MRQLDEVTGEIVDAAFHIHYRLGPGLFENVYEAILTFELERRGLGVERQKALQLEYEGIKFEECYRADLVVEQRVIVELKSTELLLPVHTKQLLTYLKLTDLRVGLLINFGAEKIGDGIKRVVNQHTRPTTSRLPVLHRV